MSRRRRLIIIAAVFVGVIVFGTIGFALFEPTVHSTFEAFYFTMVTITTVGYGDIMPTTAASRAIAIAVMIVGIGAALSLLQSAFDVALHKNIREELGLPERRTRMKDHYIICGYGNVGRQIMEQLKLKGEKYIIIEKDRKKVEGLVEAGVPVIEGDSEHEEVLDRANVKEAKGLLTSMPDPINLMVVITARMLNPNLYIVSEVEDNRNVAKLKRAGADEIVHCHEMGARVMVTKARRTVTDAVCGMEVDKDRTRFFYVYDGKEYYFCSEQCLDAFKNTPQRFIEMQRVVDASGSIPPR